LITGQRRWAVNLYESDGLSYRNRGIAASAQHLVSLTRLPRWQIWLLKLNRNLYLR
jgi:hypothetical protein